MIALPWRDETTPNVMLEVTNACNLACRACYAFLGTSFKSLEELSEEVTTARTLRPIDTVTLTGGEPLLHPRLDEVVRMLADQNLNVFLLTNGVRASAERLKRLKEAGLSDILFHVDFGQNRSDIPSPATLPDIQDKLTDLMKMAEGAGLDPSISFTLYDEPESVLEELLDWFLFHPSGTMLFLSDAKDPLHPVPLDQTRWESISTSLEQRYGVKPFACIPATGVQNPPVWYSYFIPIKVESRESKIYPYQGTVADLGLMRLGRLLKGTYMHRMPKHERLIRLRVALEGLTSFKLRSAWQFLRRKPHTHYQHKMLVYDGGPYLTESGELVNCSYCPTAILKQGELVKCCELQSAVKR